MAYMSSKEIAYRAINYTDPRVIQGLLRHYFDFKSKANTDFNEELICVFLDVENATFHVNLTVRQQEALIFYMEGWTIDEIGLKMDITHQAVHLIVVRACRKISRYLS